MRPEQARDMAAYNRWMNRRLYDVCAGLTDEQRRRDCGAFFKSIHGTLNHLVLADQIWLGRFMGEPFHFERLDQELHHDFDELRSAREAVDERIVQWTASLTAADLEHTLRYTSAVNPKPRAYEMWLAVAHFFNHQTHHRGQITTLLSQLGHDVGVTDLVWLPEVVERNASAE